MEGLKVTRPISQIRVQFHMWSRTESEKKRAEILHCAQGNGANLGTAQEEPWEAFSEGRAGLRLGGAVTSDQSSFALLKARGGPVVAGWCTARSTGKRSCVDILGWVSTCVTTTWINRDGEDRGVEALLGMPVTHSLSLMKEINKQTLKIGLRRKRKAAERKGD